MNRFNLLTCICLVGVVAFVTNSCLGQADSNVTDADNSTLPDISKSLSNSPTTDQVRRHSLTIISGLRNFEQSSLAIPVAEFACEIMQKGQQNDTNLDLIEVLHRETADAHFENGNQSEQKKHLNSLQNLYGQILKQRGDTWRGDYKKRTHRVVLDYLRTNQIDEGFDVLTLILNLPFSELESFNEYHYLTAASLNRHLKMMRPEDRFELLLKWSVPDDVNKQIRKFTSFVPVVSPPPVFARDLGERPKENSFQVASVGPFSGLFSTEWELVQSAVEAGRLRELAIHLEKIENQRSSGSHSLFTLASIVNGEESAGVEELLKSWKTIAGSEFAIIPEEKSKETRLPFDNKILDDLILVAAILKKAPASSMAREILTLMNKSLSSEQQRQFGPYLQRAVAESKVMKGPVSSNHLANPSLKHWVVTRRENSSADESLISPLWLCHESHLLHLTGQNEDFLCLRYPITGDFSFSCEAQASRINGADGNLDYNGRSYSLGYPSHYFSTWNDNPSKKLTKPFEFVRTADWPLFQHFKIVSNGIQTNYTINRHPAYSEKFAQPPTPWLSLRCPGDQVTAYRGINLSGDPVIPDQVLLSSTDSLTGWYGDVEPKAEGEPNFLNKLLSAVAQSRAWRSKDGVIQNDMTSGNNFRANQSQLTYFRPLMNEEMLSYDFFYQPGKHEVHPALGRIAFLLEPKGVMVHWITKQEDDWTGLRSDNSILEPLNRRGPRPLPLKDSQWNNVELHFQDSMLQIFLNDELIYERRMEQDRSNAFSFYHDRNRSSVKVKNVLLLGKWSQHREALLSGNLLEPEISEIQKQNRLVLSDLCNEIQVSDSAFYIHQIAKRMELDERYDFLKSWVLPGNDHQTFRLALDFSKTHPSPIKTKERKVPLGGFRVQTGGELICPACDLIEAARQLGRLEELRDHAMASVVEGEYQHRCRLAILTVLHQELAEFDQGSAVLEELTRRVVERTYLSFSGRWPETFVITNSIGHPHFKEDVGELATRILDVKIRKQVVRHPLVWERHLEEWTDRLRYDQMLKQQSDFEITKLAVTKPADWSPASKITAWSRGRGMPTTEWKFQKNEAHAVSKHDDEYLFFHTPLRGNFEVECEVRSFEFHETQLCYAGMWVAPYYTLEEYEIGNYRDWFPKRNLDPKMSPTGHWIRCRMKIQNRHASTWFNGRLIHEQELLEEHLPWLAVRCYSFTAGGIRDMRVTGTPDIPEEVHLSVLPDLDGWISYEGIPVAGKNGHWKQQGGKHNGGTIVANREPGLVGQAVERLLYYQRPIFEDGVIEYDFYYEEGITEVHPVLDRHVFVLSKDGVQSHWMTDHDHERTLDPLNLQRDSVADFILESPPLRQSAWNRLRIQIIGDAVELSLNGEKVYRSQIAATNQRYFGLFHYGDQTNVKIRNVVWKGDWAKVLPHLQHQRFVDKELLAITEQAERLPLRFVHDFRKDGYSAKKFSFSTTGKGSILSQPNGLHMQIEGGSGYSETRVSPKLVLRGDYDLVVKFRQLKMEAERDKGHSGLALQGVHFDKERTHCTCARGKSSVPGDHREIMLGEITRLLREGSPTTFHGISSEECTEGRLRIIRHGDQIHYLLAEGESPNYRLISSQPTTEAETLLDGVRMRVHTVGIAKDGLLKSEVVWESLTIRAEKAIANFGGGLPIDRLDINR